MVLKDFLFHVGEPTDTFGEVKITGANGGLNITTFKGEHRPLNGAEIAVKGRIWMKPPSLNDRTIEIVSIDSRVKLNNELIQHSIYSIIPEPLRNLGWVLIGMALNPAARRIYKFVRR